MAIIMRSSMSFPTLISPIRIAKTFIKRFKNEAQVGENKTRCGAIQRL